MTISAHRIISHALQGGFREAAAESIELKEDEPDAISDTLQFMYGRIPWEYPKQTVKLATRSFSIPYRYILWPISMTFQAYLRQ